MTRPPRPPLKVFVYLLVNPPKIDSEIGKIYKKEVSKILDDLLDKALMIKNALSERGFETKSSTKYREEREGDVRHSQADVSKIRLELNYSPKYNVRNGLEETIDWFLSKNCEF